MIIHSHGIKKLTNLIGDLAGHPDPVYLDPEGIATILSLSNVKSTTVSRMTAKAQMPSSFTNNTTIYFPIMLQGHVLP